ncbi:MAG: DUF3574 domain-containing protein [Victivallales bacterium]|nr:DUF3574 domain-containing protein [Victivallales bacterium]
MNKYFLTSLLIACLLLSGCMHTSNSEWREYKIFCGSSSKAGEVTQEQWLDFCEKHVTTAFPDGYTSIDATGYWKSGDKPTEREKSRMLLILAPADAQAKVQAIARQYLKRFQQDAVLIVTSNGSAEFVEYQ